MPAKGTSTRGQPKRSERKTSYNMGWSAAMILIISGILYHILGGNNPMVGISLVSSGVGVLVVYGRLFFGDFKNKDIQ